MRSIGDDGVGKESLINSLRRGNASEQGTRLALEYTYIDPFGPEDEGDSHPGLCQHHLKTSFCMPHPGSH